MKPSSYFLFIGLFLLAFLTIVSTYGSIPRRFPPISGCDTLVAFAPGQYRSNHGEASFIRDSEILSVNTIVGEQAVVQNRSLNFSYTRFHKAILQQQSIRGCTAAVTQMLILDHQGRVDIRSLYNTNLGNEFRIANGLRSGGLNPVVTYLKKGTTEAPRLRVLPKDHHSQTQIQLNHLDPQSFREVTGFQDPMPILKTLIEWNGSLIVSVGGELGGHVIIVDEVNLEQNWSRIRDPYHGWEIIVTNDAIRRRSPTYAIQITL